MKDRTPWVVINANHGGRFECERCGRFHEPTYPIETWALSALSDGFVKEHRGCKEKAEGLHCTYCNETGHEPEKCPSLNATTPAQWLAGPDTGISSRTIYGALNGGYGYVGDYGGGSRVDIPYDPDDFGRCYRLLKLFPAWRERLPAVAERHPAWAPFVAAWDELTALYEEEIQRPDRMAPKLYNRMQQLRVAR